MSIQAAGKSAKRLIFINAISEADHYAGSIRPGDICIALAPNVRAYLLKKEIFAEDTARYFTNASHESALLRSKELIDWLRSRIDLSDSASGIRVAYKDLLIFWARLAMHNFIWTTEIILNAIDANRPESICASLSGACASHSFSIEPEERYLGCIALSIAEHRGIRFEDLMEGAYSGGTTVRLMTYLALIWDSIFKYGRFKIWLIITIIQSRVSRHRVIFLASPRYQMDKMASDMHKSIPGASFYVLKSSVIIQIAIHNAAIRLFWPNHSNHIIENKNRMKVFEREIAQSVDLFSYRGISFAGFLAKKIGDSIANYVVGLMLWTVQLRNAVDAVKPMAIISNGTRTDDVALAEICKARNVPDILISHASHVPPNNEYENIEWGELSRGLLMGPFSHLAMQSPLSEAYHRAFPTESRRIETGPLIWGRVIDRQKGARLFREYFEDKYDRKNMKVVVHAGTPRMSKFLRFYVYETSDEYIRALVDLSRAIEAIPNAILIIKFRPSVEIGPEDVKALVGFSDRVVLMVEETFGDVLGMADMLVSFSSTTIEEALQNGVPVLQYGGGGRYQHVVGYKIKRGESLPLKAVYHVKETEDLEYAIRSMLDADTADRASLFGSYVYPKESRKQLADVLRAF